MTDAQIIDWLEREANHDPLLLHALPVDAKFHGFRGLGLNSTGRSLRKAVEDAARFDDAITPRDASGSNDGT